jgi:hypothetical protein
MSGDIPVALTRAVRNSVKNVKLRINPVTTPNGLRFPPVMEPDRTMGRIGRIHGERIVTIPPTKANRSNTNIYVLYITYCIVIDIIGA